MAVREVPGFWGSLGQGVSAGVEGFQDAKRRKQQEAMQRANVAIQLLEQGLIDNTETQAALAEANMPFPVEASEAQRRRELLERPAQAAQPDVSTMPISMPGIGSMPAQQVQQAQPERAGGLAGASMEELMRAGIAPDAQSKYMIADIQQRMARGEEVSEAEADVAGLTTVLEREQERMKTMDPLVVNSTAQTFDATLVEMAGGTVTSQNIAEVTKAAYERWKQMWQESRIGPMTPEVLEQGWHAIGQAAANRLLKEKQLEISRDRSLMYNASRQGTEINQRMQALNSTASGLQRRIAGILSNAKIPQWMWGMPEMEGFPGFQAIKDEYNELIGQLESTLQNIDALNATPPTGAPGFQSTPIAGGGGGAAAAPAAGGMPTARVDIEGFADAIVRGEVSMADARRRRDQGHMTKEQFSNLERLVRAKRASKEKSVTRSATKPPAAESTRR